MSTDSITKRVGITRHDLRNPLGEAIGFAEILIEEAEEQKLARLIPGLSRIHEAATGTLARLNRELTTENLRSDPALVEGLIRSIAAVTITITDGIAAVEAACAELNNDDFADDLLRIREAVNRLAERAPSLIRDLLNADEPDIDDLAETVLLTRSDVTPGEHRPTGETVFLHRPVDTDAAATRGTVLVVDDNEANRALLTRRLTRQGYTVAVAEDGQRALDLLTRESFDIVLLDILMPGMDGHQVLLNIKTTPSLRHLPVIMISGLDDLDNLVRCIENGAEDYLTKPFDPVLLRARIGASLEKKRLRDRELQHLSEIDQQRRRADQLLQVILPPSIAAELKEHDRVQPRRHPDVAVLFADVTGFTDYCGRNTPERVVDDLQKLVAHFEEISDRHGLEKIKTVGDAFMATAGLLHAVDDPALNAAEAALAMCAAARRLECDWRVHVGIHVGPVVAGVIGTRKFHFDVWGDTVNTAARIADLAGAEGVLVSEAVWQRIAGRFEGRSVGRHPVKGKGEMEAFEVTAIRT